jgi:hypothetical protein
LGEGLGTLKALPAEGDRAASTVGLPLDSPV